MTKVLTFLAFYYSCSLFSAIYFYVLLLNVYVYDEYESVDFFVLGLLDKSNDLILSNQV